MASTMAANLAVAAVALSGCGGGGSWALQDSVSSDASYQVGQSGYSQPA